MDQTTTTSPLATMMSPPTDSGTSLATIQEKVSIEIELACERVPGGGGGEGRASRKT